MGDSISVNGISCIIRMLQENNIEVKQEDLSDLYYKALGQNDSVNAEEFATTIAEKYGLENNEIIIQIVAEMAENDGVGDSLSITDIKLQEQYDEESRKSANEHSSEEKELIAEEQKPAKQECIVAEENQVKIEEEKDTVNEEPVKDNCQEDDNVIKDETEELVNINSNDNENNQTHKTAYLEQAYQALGINPDGTLPEDAPAIVKDIYERIFNKQNPEDITDFSAIELYKQDIDTIKEFSKFPEFVELMQKLYEDTQNTSPLDLYNNDIFDFDAYSDPVQFAKDLVILSKNLELIRKIYSDCMISLGITPNSDYLVQDSNSDLETRFVEYEKQTEMIKKSLEQVQLNYSENLDENGFIKQIKITDADGNIHTYYFDENNKIDTLEEVYQVLGVSEDGTLPENAPERVKEIYRQFLLSNTPDNLSDFSAVEQYKKDIDIIKEFSKYPEFVELMQEHYEDTENTSPLDLFNSDSSLYTGCEYIQYARNTVVSSRNINMMKNALADCMISLGIMPDSDFLIRDINMSPETINYQDQLRLIVYSSENANLYPTYKCDKNGFIKEMNITDENGNVHTYHYNKNHQINTAQVSTKDGAIYSSAKYNEDGSYVITKYNLDGTTTELTSKDLAFVATKYNSDSTTTEQTSKNLVLQSLVSDTPIGENSIGDVPIANALSNATTVEDMIDTVTAYCSGDTKLAAQIINGIFSDESFLNAAGGYVLSVDENLNITINDIEYSLSNNNPLHNKKDIIINSMFDYRNGEYVLSESVLNSISQNSLEFDENDNITSGIQYYSDTDGNISSIKTEYTYDEEGNVTSSISTSYDSKGQIRYRDEETFFEQDGQTLVSIKRYDKYGNVIPQDGIEEVLTQYQYTHKQQLEAIARKYTDRNDLSYAELLQYSTIDYLTSNNSELQEMLIGQDYNEGIISKGYNGVKEGTGWFGTPRSEIAGIISNNNENTQRLIDALNNPNVSFEEVFKEIYGVEYDQQAIDIMRISENSLKEYSTFTEEISQNDEFLIELYNSGDLELLKSFFDFFCNDNPDEDNSELIDQLFDNFIQEQKDNDFLRTMEFVHLAKMTNNTDEYLSEEVNQKYGLSYPDFTTIVASNSSGYPIDNFDSYEEYEAAIEQFYQNKFKEHFGDNWEEKYNQFIDAGYKKPENPSVYKIYATENLNNNFKAAGIDPDYIFEDYLDITKLAFGQTSFTEFSEATSSYIKDQQSFKNKLMTGVRATGTCMMIGGSIVFCVPGHQGLGQGLIKVGSFVSKIGIYGDDFISGIEAATKQDFSPDEMRQILQNTGTHLLMQGSGEIIGSFAKSGQRWITDKAINHNYTYLQSALIGHGLKTTIDMSGGLLSYKLITGKNPDITSQFLINMLSYATGVAGTLQNAKKIYGNMSLHDMANARKTGITPDGIPVLGYATGKTTINDVYFPQNGTTRTLTGDGLRQFLPKNSYGYYFNTVTNSVQPNPNKTDISTQVNPNGITPYNGGFTLIKDGNTQYLFDGTRVDTAAVVVVDNNPICLGGVAQQTVTPPYNNGDIGLPCGNQDTALVLSGNNSMATTQTQSFGSSIIAVNGGTVPSTSSLPLANSAQQLLFSTQTVSTTGVQTASSVLPPDLSSNAPDTQTHAAQELMQESQAAEQKVIKTGTDKSTLKKTITEDDKTTTIPQPLDKDGDYKIVDICGIMVNNTFVPEENIIEKRGNTIKYLNSSGITVEYNYETGCYNYPSVDWDKYIVIAKDLDGNDIEFKIKSERTINNQVVPIVNTNEHFLNMKNKNYSFEDVINERHITRQEKEVINSLLNRIEGIGDEYLAFVKENPDVFIGMLTATKEIDGKLVSVYELISDEELNTIKNAFDQYNNGNISKETVQSIIDRMNMSLPYHLFEYIDDYTKIPAEGVFDPGSDFLRSKEDIEKMLDMAKNLREFLGTQATDEAISLTRIDDLDFFFDNIVIDGKTAHELLLNPSSPDDIKKVLSYFNGENVEDVVFPNFIGTSIGKRFNLDTTSNEKILWQIELPRNSQGIFLNGALPKDQRSMYNEREFLLQAGTRFVIKEASYENGTLVIQVAAVTPEKINIDLYTNLDGVRQSENGSCSVAALLNAIEKKSMLIQALANKFTYNAKKDTYTFSAFGENFEVKLNPGDNLLQKVYDAYIALHRDEAGDFVTRVFDEIMSDARDIVVKPTTDNAAKLMKYSNDDNSVLTFNTNKPIEGLETDHAYTVIGIDENGNMKLQDPLTLEEKTISKDTYENNENCQIVGKTYADSGLTDESQESFVSGILERLGIRRAPSNVISNEISNERFNVQGPSYDNPELNRYTINHYEYGKLGHADFCEINSVLRQADGHRPWWSDYRGNGMHGAWKMHIFADNETEWQMLVDACGPYLIDSGVEWKTMSANHSPEDLQGVQAGKAFTVYPSNAKEFAEIARGLDYIIRNNGLTTQNSSITGDAPLGNTGRLSYRYEFSSKNITEKGINVLNPNFAVSHNKYYEKNSIRQNYYADHPRQDGLYHLAFDMNAKDDPWLTFDPSKPKTEQRNIPKVPYVSVGDTFPKNQWGIVSSGRSICLAGSYYIDLYSPEIRSLNPGQYLTVGRLDSCDIVIPADIMEVSRQHCIIYKDKYGNIYIKDTSLYGTTMY